MFWFLSNPQNLDPTTFSSSYSLSSSFSNSPLPAYSTSKKHIPNARINEGCSTDVDSDDKFEKKPTLKNVEIEGKVVVRKQPLWEKLLFTSKKIRSVVLLNFITIVYGMSLLSVFFVNNLIFKL